MTAALLAGVVGVVQVLPWDWRDQIPPLTPLTAVEQAQLNQAAGHHTPPPSPGLYRASWQTNGVQVTHDLLLQDGQYVETLSHARGQVVRQTTRQVQYVQAGDVLRLERRGILADWGKLLVVLHGPLRLKLADGQVRNFSRIWTPETTGADARMLHSALLERVVRSGWGASPLASFWALGGRPE